MPWRERAFRSRRDVPVGLDAVLVALCAAREDVVEGLRPHARDRHFAQDAEGLQVGDASNGGVAGEGRRDAPALRRVVGVVGKGDDRTPLFFPARKRRDENKK